MRMNKVNATQTHKTHTPHHFVNIQALRGIAALIVVLFHLHTIESKYFSGHVVPAILGICGTAGVDLFFVISGFVMMTVSSGRFGKAGGASNFLLRRAVRIYPIYWFYALIVLVVLVCNASVGECIRKATRRTSLRRLPFSPTRTVPLLIQAWTLTYEVFFYVVFAVLIRGSSERMASAWLCTWGAVTLAGHWYFGGQPENALAAMVSSPLVLEFIGGCMIAKIYPRLERGAAYVCLLIAAGLVAGSFPVRESGHP